MLTVAVPSEDLSYPIRIGSGLLDRVGREVVEASTKVRRVALITDDTVAQLYAERAKQSLVAQGLKVSVHAITPGERSKTPETLLGLVAEMVGAGLSRDDLVVTLGGGVVGDIGGLAAALFMRGISVIQCPTSLLAQVDASVGGKVAVDLGAGKNLLGAFHFPDAVVIDTAVLSTLDDGELGCGLGEMVKHGLLFDSDHLARLVGASDAIYARDPKTLAGLVAHSVALKAACVSRDPLERASSGKGRILLNLGHTVGHAIEHASNYRVRHGEAVAIGLQAAARISEVRGLAAPGFEEEVCKTLSALRLPCTLDTWLAGEEGASVGRALLQDKKRAGTSITYIALRGVGDPCTLALRVDEILRLLRRHSSA